MICKNCRADIKSDETVCKFCGSEVERPQATQNIIINNYNYAAEKSETKQNSTNINHTINTHLVSSKNKTVALILCIVFGYFGVHQFYVGKSSKGWLYLFTMGLFGFGWLIDIVVIATGNFKDKFGLKLK